MILTIVNSYVYIYGKNIQKHRERIKEIAGRYSKIGTGSDKLLLNIDYRVNKEIRRPEDITEYINEFISYIDELISEIEDEIDDIIIDYHSVSNIVFSGKLDVGEGNNHIDLYKIREELLREYGDRIMKADKPLSNGNEFAGLIITFYIDPTKRNRKGEIVKRRNRSTIILFSNGRFVWTGVNDNLYTDPEKVKFFYDVFKFISEKSREEEEELDLTTLYI